MKKNIYIFTRCVWTFINFRSDLVKRIDKEKYNVTVCMDFDGQNKNKIQIGYSDVSFLEINFLNAKNKYINNLKIIIQIFRLFFKNKIDVVHNFTARPIVFVSLVSLFFKRIRVINTITGLGNNFFKNKKLFLLIYNLIFLISDRLVFQNKLDKKTVFKFLQKKININIIYPTVKFKKNVKIKKTNFSKIIFTMHCRMIKQKGVMEYIGAAKNIKEKFKNKCFFYLIGDPDLNNPSSINLKYLKDLNKNKIIKYIKHQKNIKKYVINSDVIVLPSYGEGMPASLLEALFFKKAIITTNVNGCSELVKHNYNGYLISRNSSIELEGAISKMLKNPKIINNFGKNSFEFFKKKFSNDPIKKYLKIYQSI